MTFNETEDKTLNTEIEDVQPELEEEELAAEESEPEHEESEHVIEAEESASEEPEHELDDSQIRAAALAYARYLMDNDIELGEASSPEAEDAGDKPEEAPADAEEDEKTQEVKPEEAADQEKQADGDKKEEARKASELEKIRKREEAKARNKEKFLNSGTDPLASVTNLHDKVQDGIDRTLIKLGKDIIRGAHRISSAYGNTRRGIGLAVLATGLVITAILIVFDMFTVYEYAYNGKVLGYVNSQEEVTDVLDVAGRQLTYNSSTEADVKFVANQNVTFNPVDGRGKSTDDSDTVVNKLIYMTDIETEAYAVYDGDKVVAIVKDQNDADKLLLQTKADLSTPDRGMELVSADFTNELSVKPINVLLGSVQSNAAAQEQMTKGGMMNTYHIVEEGESVQSLAAGFGVEDFEIYDESNKEQVTEVETGDRVCIRNSVSPVSVKMVEKGKLKEVIEYKTIKKETDEYYKGDSYLEQEGQDGVQIFEGVITKIGGEVTDRKETAKPEVIKKKKDKIILVGTAERPKTAATGTFIVPLDHYVITSEWGGRWGRMHEGMDLAAPTGTPIYASDGGKIIKANYWSGHGLCVEIDHGNGVITRYSHCSATLVSVGDLVYQGQHIANVGNTGHSFGSHCHFEVRVNGSSQNPRNYINP